MKYRSIGHKIKIFEIVNFQIAKCFPVPLRVQRYVGSFHELKQFIRKLFDIIERPTA